MTIIEAIYSVLQGLNVSTDDHGIPKRFVYRELVNARSELLAQEANKMRLWGGGYSQILHRVKMRYQDISQCPDLPTGVMLHRSCIQLPKGVSTDDGELITGIYTLAGKSITLKSSYEEILAHYGKRFVLPGPLAWIDGDRRINIVGMDHVEDFFIRAHGVFIRPEEVAKYNECCNDEGEVEGTACTPTYMLEFDLPGNIDRRVIEIAKNAVSLRLGIPSDVNNDAALDLKPGTNVQNPR